MGLSYFWSILIFGRFCGEQNSPDWASCTNNVHLRSILTLCAGFAPFRMKYNNVYILKLTDNLEICRFCWFLGKESVSKAELTKIGSRVVECDI